LKETSFIEQNKEKWNKFEKLYESKSNDPEELSNLYMDITEDLSYAQTFYKRRTVRVYLNELAQRVYTGVHKQKADSFKKLLTVWKVSLPLEIYRSRKNLLFALITFLIYVAIGAINTHMDPGFFTEIVGPQYRDMTLRNIEMGDPLGVYESPDQMSMFIRITTNNLKVAFLTFFVGFFFTIGTHILLFGNGVMLGSFQYFFHTKGLLVTSFLGIWIHGAFEISAIVLAGGAGLTAGNGLLFPKSYTRIQSLQLSTKRGLKIMLSLVPFIIMAGFLESFVTANYQELADWSKWTLIGLSFALILFYYVFYPMYVARKYPELVNKEEVGNFKPKTTFSLNRIRNVGELISDSFRLYRLEFGKIAKINTLITLPIIIGVVAYQDYVHYNLQQTEYWYDWAAQLKFMMGYGFINTSDLVVCLIWTFIFAFIMTSIFWCVKTAGEPLNWKEFRSYAGRKYFGIWLANILLAATVLILPWNWLILAFFILPFYYLNGASVGLGEGKYGRKFGKGFKYSAQHYGKTLLTLLILFVIVFLIMQPFATVMSIHDYRDEPAIMSDLLDVASEFIKRVAQIYTDDYIFPANVFRQVVYLGLLFVIFPLIVITMAFSYFSEEEKSEAKGLRKSFEKFGRRSRVRETEVDFE
jgi:uncharacterized membrane protein SpoIIM required for sporulation